MNEKKIHFFSDGVKLMGSLYTPHSHNKRKKLPAVIICSGYTGLSVIYPRLFAPMFTSFGFACLGFDYRGSGESSGVRGRLIPQEQVRDIRHSVVFLKEQSCIDANRIFLLGWGMGAGLVICAAPKEESVRGVAAVNGFFNGEQFMRHAFSPAKFRALLKTIRQDKTERVIKGKINRVYPFDIYPLDTDTKSIVYTFLRPVDNYNIKVTIETAEAILDFNALHSAKHLRAPIFVAHGKWNKLHPVEQSHQLYRMAKHPKHWHLIKGKHNDFMFADNAVFQELCRELASWIEGIS